MDIYFYVKKKLDLCSLPSGLQIRLQPDTVCCSDEMWSFHIWHLSPCNHNTDSFFYFYFIFLLKYFWESLELNMSSLELNMSSSELNLSSFPISDFLKQYI